MITFLIVDSAYANSRVVFGFVSVHSAASSVGSRSMKLIKRAKNMTSFILYTKSSNSSFFIYQGPVALMFRTNDES